MPESAVQRIAIVGLAWLGCTMPLIAAPDEAVVLINVYAVDTNGAEIWVGQGSGAVANLEGAVVTAKHVVEAKKDDIPGERVYRVRFESRALIFPADLPRPCADGKIDLCVLKISPSDLRTANVDEVFRPHCAPPPVDARVKSYGLLDVPFARVTHTDGIVGSGAGEGEKYASNITIISGMSGGPVVWDDKLIGVNVGARSGTLAYIQALSSARTLMLDSGLHECQVTALGRNAGPSADDPISPNARGAYEAEPAPLMGSNASPGNPPVEEVPEEIELQAVRIDNGAESSDASCAALSEQIRARLPAGAAEPHHSFVLRADDGCEFTADIRVKLLEGKELIEEQSFERSADRTKLLLNLSVGSPDVETDVLVRVRLGQRQRESGDDAFVASSHAGGWVRDGSQEIYYRPSNLESSDELLRFASFSPMESDHVVAAAAGELTGGSSFACGDKTFVIDRIEAPAPGRPRRDYSEVVHADWGCRIAFVIFGAPIANAPDQYLTHVLGPEGQTALIEYGFSVPTDKAEHLWAVAKIVQAPFGVGLVGSSAGTSVDVHDARTWGALNAPFVGASEPLRLGGGGFLPRLSLRMFSNPVPFGGENGFAHDSVRRGVRDPILSGAPRSPHGTVDLTGFDPESLALKY